MALRFKPNKSLRLCYYFKMLPNYIAKEGYK